MLSVLKKNWFLIGIIVVISLAKFAPEIGSKGGVLMPEITVKYIAVFIIFFNSGISLKSEDLGRALLQVKVHVFIQGFTFILFPVIIFALVGFLSIAEFNQQVLEGLKILSCLPPPVSSAVILTKAVGGNEAAAIFNSAFGSFLGIAVTPTLILALVGSKAAVPVASIFLQLTATVVLPLIIGQWIRRYLANFINLKSVPWGQIGSGVLLLIIYATFCDTFSQESIDVDPSSFFITVILIICIQLCLLYSVFTFSSSRLFHFSRSDTVALMFCCTHKSLTLGIPIIKIIFADSASLSLITIPLLVYHPTQILLGGLLVPSVRSWMLSGPRSGRGLFSYSV
ncbi:sodium/bile acid cotransporter 7-like isoform X2 [Ruditapes philippinarum]|uniref:sodium/bile acid cotransporter 7-like isoform X2 n=1 Tax=Ruditapes philippinarum TaxID=129788 RepID=UPI00295B5B98|nr:sodium/bile acid cotransporter 7-like isoform X2 [Ruditapes philippinarum]